MTFFLTQSWNKEIEKRFLGTQEPRVLVSDSLSSEIPHYTPSIPQGWPTISDRVYPGCIDYYILDWESKNPLPEDEYLWFVEYDILWTGREISKLQETLDKNYPSDFLSPTPIIQRKYDPDWWWWKSGEWDYPEPWFHTLCPIRRYSKRLLNSLREYYEERRTPVMHFEAVIPTVAYAKGYRVRTIPREYRGKSIFPNLIRTYST